MIIMWMELKQLGPDHITKGHNTVIGYTKKILFLVNKTKNHVKNQFQRDITDTYRAGVSALHNCTTSTSKKPTEHTCRTNENRRKKKSIKVQ